MVCTFTVTIRPMPGVDIQVTIHEASLLAQRLGCGIEFAFNDIRVYVWPHSDEATVYGYYLADMCREDRKRP